MFHFWKRRSNAPAPAPPSPPTAQSPRARAGAEGAAGTALAGPAEPEAPARARRRTPRPRYSPEAQARILSDFAESNLSQRVFATQSGVSVSTLQKWLRRESAAPGAPSRYANRFSPEERRAAVEAYLKSGRKRRDFAKLWGCSPSSLDKWLRRYRDEGPKGLETRSPEHKPGRPHPTRLPDAVRERIVELAREHPDFGSMRVADELARFDGVRVSPSGVLNILRAAGVAGQPHPRKHRRPKPKLPRRFERSKPCELWQSDITSFVLRRHSSRVYLTVFLDDFSRYVVSWALATHQRTPLVTEALQEGIARFGKPREVLTDQGRQYYAWRGKSAFQKLLAKEGIAHVVSRAHHPETLGKCERLWKTVGDEFWDRAAPQDLDDARRRLGHWLRHYNHFRPHQGIGGLVPADRFFGAESAVREALQADLAANELRLALGQAVRKRVYLTGQIGEQRISLHGERGRLLVDTPEGGRRELAMEELGVREDESHTEQSHDEREQDRSGTPRTEQFGAGLEPQAAQAHGPQAQRVSQDAAPGLAGAGTLGERAAGGAGGGAQDLHADAGVLAGEAGQDGGGEGAGRLAAARVAAEPAGAVGDAGGAPAAAAEESEAECLRAQGDGVPGLDEPAHHGAGEGARADRGPGARLAHRALESGRDTGSEEGRPEPWSEEEASRQADASHGASGCPSPGASAGARGRGRSWRRWLRRTE